MENQTNSYSEIASLLLQKGYLTEEQIKYADRVRSKLNSSKSLLSILKELEYITDDQVGKVVRENHSTLRIGDLMLEFNIISDSELKAALEIQSKEKPKRKLGIFRKYIAISPVIIIWKSLTRKIYCWSSFVLSTKLATNWVSV